MPPLLRRHRHELQPIQVQSTLDGRIHAQRVDSRRQVEKQRDLLPDQPHVAPIVRSRAPAARKGEEERRATDRFAINGDRAVLLFCKQIFGQAKIKDMGLSV